jgi:Holliday junction DNA helicase RuvA
MIDYVKGKVAYIDLQYVVIEANGIGYQIQSGNPFQYQDLVDNETLVYTYQHVREDILALYGFATREERTLFEKLLHVSGIGPKGALAILATGTPGQVIGAIQAEDVSFLTKFPGIGKKTAQRLILDLKDKLDDLAQRFPAKQRYAVDAQVNSTGIKGTSKTNSLSLNEALEALTALGYSDKELDRIIYQLKEKSSEDMSTDRYIKLGLQLLAK